MNEKKRNLRPLALFLSVVLLAVGVVGGTYAWLIDQTDTVENTFTYGDINIDLEETDTGDGDNNPLTNEYKMIPGATLAKDPKVTVEKGSEACWLFVKLEEKGSAKIYDETGNLVKSWGFDDYLTWDIAEEWIQLYDADGNAIENVYYRYVAEDTDGEGITYDVLKDNEIKVLGEVTKEMLNAIDDSGDNKDNAEYPTLLVKAFAVQYSGFEGADEKDNGAALSAWDAIGKQN